jgi:hypothetical protein
LLPGTIRLGQASYCDKRHGGKVTPVTGI